MALRFDLHPRSNPKNGAALVSFTKLQAAEYRREWQGTGSGRFSIRADDAEAQFLDPRGNQYVRVYDTEVSTTVPIGGFWTDPFELEAITEKSTRLLTIKGPGTLAYLDRAALWSHSYIGDDPFDDQWRFHNAGTGTTLGAMFARAVNECLSTQADDPGDQPDSPHPNADDRTVYPLPDLTIDFSYTVDSDGTPWPAFDNEFVGNVTESLLSIAQRMMALGLIVRMDPDTFVLSAYVSKGTDRTGLAWGPSVVRLQKPTDGTVGTGNIKTESSRSGQASIRRSSLLVGSQDVYAKAVDAGADIPWEGGFHAEPTDDASALETIGNAQLAAREDASDTARLRIAYGNDPSGGRYRPVQHFVEGDTVTLHSGTGAFDWDDAGFLVAAITWQARKGGTSPDVWVDFGTSYRSFGSREFQASGGMPAHRHPPNPRLCEPAGGFVETGSDWRVLNIAASSEPAGWLEVGFDDSAWAQGVEVTGAAGLQMVKDPADGSVPSDVCIARREYIVDEDDLSGAAVVFKYALDNAGKVWVNGVEVASLTGAGATNYTSDHATTLARSAFVAGVNVIGVRIENESSGTPGGTPPGPYSGGVYIELPVDRWASTGRSRHAARCDHPHRHNDLLGRFGVQHHLAAGIEADDGSTVQDHIDDGAAHGGIELGALTPSGSPAVVTNDAVYNAFPSLIRTRDGVYHLFYSKGTDHTSTDTYGVRKSSATPGGLPGASEVTVNANPGGGFGASAGRATVIASGRVYLAFSHSDGTSPPAGSSSRRNYVKWSDDHCATWSDPVEVTTHGFTSWGFLGGGGVVELPNGRLLLPFYGSNDGGTTRDSKVLYSDDRGATWAVLATIADSGSFQFNEPLIIRLRDGTLSCLIREETGEDIYTTTSTDEGATWSTPTIAFDGKARPDHAQLLSGRWLYVSRENPNGDTIYRTRTDDDATWTGETILDATGTRNVYASILQTTPATVLVAYGIENSTTDADIRLETFTDASTGYALHDDLADVTPDQHHAQRHEMTSATNHFTDETDTSLVLKPDGAGGVEWGASTSAFRWAPVSIDPAGDEAWEILFDDDGSVVMMEVYD